MATSIAKAPQPAAMPEAVLERLAALFAVAAVKGLRGYCRRRAPDVATAAKTTRAALEALLDMLEWPEEPAFSRAIDRLVQLEERQG